MLKIVKKRRIKLLAFILLAVVGLLFFLWGFQALPQRTIYLFDDLSLPKAGERALVFSPHPDDETIAAGGYIAESLKNGGEVWIVLMTDGNKHGLEERRYLEFGNAVRILGVDKGRLVFLNYPDGKLNKADPEKLKEKIEKIVSDIEPKIVILPALEDRHPDHSATARVVLEAISGKNLTFYQYLVHYPWFPQPRKTNFEFYLLPPIRLITTATKWERLLLPLEIEDRKHEAVLQYRSQLKSPILRELIFGMVRKNEIFVRPLSSSTR